MGGIIAMDFGLGRYLEMFEDRFGHKATTGLIVLITTGLIAVLMPLIWTNLCLPIFQGILLIISGQSGEVVSQITWRDGLAFLGTVVLVVAPLMGGVLLGHIWLDPRLRLLARKMNRLRVRAMTGGKITPNRAAVDRRTKITVIVLGVLLIIAVTSAAISSTLARRQLIVLRHQIDSEIAKRVTMDRNLDILENKVVIILNSDDALISDYKALCRRTKDETCDAKLQSVLDKRAKSFQSLPPLIRPH